MPLFLLCWAGVARHLPGHLSDTRQLSRATPARSAGEYQADETRDTCPLISLILVWCIGRGPHLQLRQEPQGTSDFRGTLRFLPQLEMRQEPQGTSDFRLRSQGPCRLGTGGVASLDTGIYL